jgi:hypothetical protein
MSRRGDGEVGTTSLLIHAYVICSGVETKYDSE